MSGTMLYHGFFEICVSRGDDRLLCRGGHTLAPDTPDRLNAIRRHTQIVPLPPGLSPPVRAILLTDFWECLLHEEGELSCRHFWEPFEQVRGLPGPIRQIADGRTLCVELMSGEVTCRAGDLTDQLESRADEPWITMPAALP